MKDITNNELDKMIQNADQVTLDSLSPEARQKLVMMVRGEELKEEMKVEMKKRRVDIDKCLLTFLDKYDSKDTRKLYEYGIAHYFKYLDSHGLHPLSIGPMEVDQYFIFVRNTMTSQSQGEAFIRPVSAFYSDLKRWGHVERNPFFGAKFPKAEEKEKVVPTWEDIQALEEAYRKDLEAKGKGANQKKAAAQKMLVIMQLLYRTGLRVGALPNIKFKADGTYVTVTKTKKFENRVPADLFEEMKALKLHKSMINKNSVQDNLGKKIREVFGCNKFDRCHGFRHYFAVKEYSETKDIYRVSQLLNHADILMTQRYLRSLKVEL